MALKYLLLLLGVQLSSALETQATVYYDSTTKSYSYVTNIMDPTGAAWGYFNDAANQTGWGILEVRTNGSYPDSVQMYAAGYLEGSLTPVPIYECYQNWVEAAGSTLTNWLTINSNWSRTNAQMYRSTDKLWYHVDLLYQQFDGMLLGYNTMAKTLKLPVYTEIEFLLLTASDDVDSIQMSLDPTSRPDWTQLSPTQFDNYVQRYFSHCSALIKLLPDYSDLYFSHATWSTYTTLNRMYKMYYFDLQDPSVKAKALIMSGYAGTLYSTDDFYMTSARLAVTETTNGVYNNSEYALISSGTLLTWLRVRAASIMSTSGKEWTHNAGRYWSGTYTNQWMIVDYKKFMPNSPLSTDVLWIMEEIPSMIHAADVTTYLARGEWPSYNVPFFHDIYNRSGYPDVVAAQGPEQSYDLAPRAKIFRHMAGKVTDLSSFEYVIRYNQYQTDPYSDSDPAHAIASRYDLRNSSSSSSPFGAIDAKVTSSSLIQNLMANAQSGPTTEGQPVFTWSTSPWANGVDYPHLGQPDSWNFPWKMMKPTLF